jgi:ribonuclease VapC
VATDWGPCGISATDVSNPWLLGRLWADLFQRQDLSAGGDNKALAAPTRTEILLEALVKLGEVGQERAREFLDQQAVLTVAWDQELADQAALAFARFGRGRHASGLNFGDCFSYALAERWKVPLLFVGNDFNRTDLEVAL